MPNFWDDAQQAEKLMREIRNLKKWVDAFENICQKQEDLTVLLEFQRLA